MEVYPELNPKVTFESGSDQHAESPNSVLPCALISPQPPAVHASANSPETAIGKPNPVSFANIAVAVVSDNVASGNDLEAETTVETQQG